MITTLEVRFLDHLPKINMKLPIEVIAPSMARKYGCKAKAKTFRSGALLVNLTLHGKLTRFEHKLVRQIDSSFTLPLDRFQKMATR